MVDKGESAHDNTLDRQARQTISARLSLASPYIKSTIFWVVCSFCLLYYLGLIPGNPSLTGLTGAAKVLSENPLIDGHNDFVGHHSPCTSCQHRGPSPASFFTYSLPFERGSIFSWREPAGRAKGKWSSTTLKRTDDDLAEVTS